MQFTFGWKTMLQSHEYQKRALGMNPLNAIRVQRCILLRSGDRFRLLQLELILSTECCKGQGKHIFFSMNNEQSCKNCVWNCEIYHQNAANVDTFFSSHSCPGSTSLRGKRVWRGVVLPSGWKKKYVWWVCGNVNIKMGIRTWALRRYSSLCFPLIMWY